LCIHWQQRFAVEFDAENGTIYFGDEQITHISATAESLKICVSAPQKSCLKELEQIIAEHINRFARKETLSFNWCMSD
jgi:Uncharacterized protein conserved in bacteria